MRVRGEQSGRCLRPSAALCHRNPAHTPGGTSAQGMSIEPRRTRRHSSAAEPAIRSSLPPWRRSRGAGAQHSVIPRISPRLADTDPTALPAAMPAAPRAVASSDTASSGRVVARLTTVAPTRNLGTPSALANHTAASTNRSPPFTVRKRPRSSMRMAENMADLLYKSEFDCPAYPMRPINPLSP